MSEYNETFGWPAGTLGEFFESPQKPPLRYFGIDPSIPPWTINHIHKTGVDVGRFQTMISEEGVPYHKGFGKHMEVGPSWATSHYMNERGDMALEAISDSNTVVLHPAGIIGWSHPDPKTIKSIQDLYDRTDRRNVARAEDRPKVRANIHNYAWTDPDTNRVRNFIIATGWVLPSVTRAEVIDIENAGISGVSTVVSTVGGVGVEMITADIVRQGRQTAGQLARPNLQAAAATMMEVFEFDAADIERVTQRKPDMAEMPAIEVPFEMDLSATKADLDKMAASFEARVDKAVSEAKAELGIVDPPPPPSEGERLAALEGDLARRADSAVAPNFAGIGDSALSRLIDGEQRENESRDDFYTRIAGPAGIAPDTVRQIVGAQIDCPPIEVLTGIAAELSGVSREQLVSAARSDGCTRYGA